jgi:hypothetical protein
VLATVLLALPLGVAAAVDVRYLQVDQYTDAGQRPLERRPSEALKRELTAEFQRLGQQYLAPGQELSIEVLDLDLAGRFQWWDASRGEVRVLDAVGWPRMRLQYRLTQGGRTLEQGEARLSDQDYLGAVSGRRADPLRYEKNMLGDWFRSRFGGGRQPG